MTNEIQVGEYVRTKKHGIFKVTELYETEGKYYILNNDKYETYTIGGGAPRFDISKDIVKHSFNIIDLIEVGDYVNGIEVEVIGYDNNENGELVETLGVAYVDDDVAWRTELKDISHIYAIVTKEQFKSMEYKVGEEDDKC